MKIMMRDDRVFQGTPLQIVRAMQDIAFGVGETDDELAASLVDEMVRTGLTRRM